MLASFAVYSDAVVAKHCFELELRAKLLEVDPSAGVHGGSLVDGEKNECPVLI